MRGRCCPRRTKRRPQAQGQRLPLATRGAARVLQVLRIRLRVEKRAEHRGPASLEILILLQSTLQQSFDSLLRFRPRKCRLKRVEGVEEPVGRWQRDPINESFR